MFNEKSEINEVKTSSSTVKVTRITYSAKEAFTQNPDKNSTVDAFKLQEKLESLDSCFAANFNVKKSWVNPGGWQSWAPGYEISPKETRPSLKNLAVSQWNVYLTVPNTPEKFYGRRYILGQFIMYFRYEEKYFFILSTGNLRENLPPVQYVYDRKKQSIEIQIYDGGKNWAKDEKAAEICIFCAGSYFEAKETINSLYRTKRFDNLEFLGKVPGGWESWYNHYSNINEKIILDDLESLVKTENVISLMYLRKDKPCVFQIDDGWEVTVGDWRIREDRFPNGLASISEKIEAKKMIPGLWIAPFLMDLRSPVAKEHPDWILKDKDGLPVSAGFNPLWGDKKGPNQPRKKGTFFCLDLSNDEVIEYIDSLIERAVNQWGIRYLKLDFLYAGMLNGKFKNGKAAYQWYYRAVKTLTKRKGNKLGKPVAYLGCGMPFEHSFNDFPLSRIGCDTSELWDNKLMKAIRWNGRTSSYLSVKDTLGRALWNQAIFLCDPDVIFVRNSNCTLTRDEKLIVATVAILFGNQIMYSDDPATSSSQEEVELANEISQIAEKFKDEEFSVIPSKIDVYRIRSKSCIYSGVIDLGKRKIIWNE